MTGGIFKKDEPALRQAEQKPRLKWPAYVWLALVCVSQLNVILSGADIRRMVRSSARMSSLASDRRDPDFQEATPDETASKRRVRRARRERTKGTAMNIGGAVAVLGICMTASLIGTPYVLYEYECQGTTSGTVCITHAAHTLVCRDGVEFLPSSWCRIGWAVQAVKLFRGHAAAVRVVGRTP